MLTVLQDQLDAARERLPDEVFEYYSAGAGEELTLAESLHTWSQFRLRPKPLRDVAAVDLGIELFGPLHTPLVVAPMAFHRLAHPEAEVASARGAADAGALLTVSTRASTRFEDVAASTTAPWWFQVYVMNDRGVTERVVERATAAGASALVLTGDTPYVGQKRRVGGVRIPMPDDHFLINIAEHLDEGADGRAAAAQDPSIGLETIDWLRRVSGLPVIVKGVLRGDAAVECVQAGADGVIVSNHGGRQLDRAVTSASVLAEVADAVGADVPVLVDGGIRSGVDVFVALALGAKAALIGRPVLWALAAGGREGVAAALTAVREDLVHAMALAGTPSISDIDRSFVRSA